MLELVSAPAALVVTVADLKTHIRQSYTDANEDSYLQALIEAATGLAEAYTYSAFITQTWNYFLDEWPECPELEIPLGPCQSITYIKYYDENGTLITWDSSQYQAAASKGRGRVALAPGAVKWPTLQQNKLRAIEIRFVAGYGNASTDVPAPIRHAIKMQAASLYSNREDEVTGTQVNKLDLGNERILSPYRFYLFA